MQIKNILIISFLFLGLSSFSQSAVSMGKNPVQENVIKTEAITNTVAENNQAVLNDKKGTPVPANKTDNNLEQKKSLPTSNKKQVEPISAPK